MNQLDTERWRPVPGWEGCYEVSDQGRVRGLSRTDARGRCWPGRIMAGSRDRSDWYVKVTLTFGRRRESRYVHRLVGEAFLGPCPHGGEVNHRDGDKTNNSVTNLEYVSHLDNGRHAGETGLLRHGNDHHARRLTPFKVQMILLLNGRVGIRTLGRWFGVDPSTIKAVRKGRTWTHVYRHALATEG